MLVLMCSFQAEDVLLSTITSGVGPAERWASVQVLVCATVVTAPVISELLHHLHDSQQHQSGRRERAADLLARSSAITVRIVQCILECVFSDPGKTLIFHSHAHYDA